MPGFECIRKRSQQAIQCEIVANRQGPHRRVPLGRTQAPPVTFVYPLDTNTDRGETRELGRVVLKEAPRDAVQVPLLVECGVQGAAPKLRI